MAIKHCFVVVGEEGMRRGGGDSSVLHLISPSVSKIRDPASGDGDGDLLARRENSSKR